MSFLLSRMEREWENHASYFHHNQLDSELQITGQNPPYSSLYKPLVYKAVHSGKNILQGNLSESKCKCQRTVHEAVDEVEIKVRRGRSRYTRK